MEKKTFMSGSLYEVDLVHGNKALTNPVKRLFCFSSCQITKRRLLTTDQIGYLSLRKSSLLNICNQFFPVHNPYYRHAVVACQGLDMAMPYINKKKIYGMPITSHRET